MNLRIEPGNYVVAVSGGVDSVVLLDLLAHRATVHNRPGSSSKLHLTVAHFDHGVREDSRQDRLFVQSLAKRYGLPFVYDEGQLGPAISEAAARFARYKFLRLVQKTAGAQAVITAHHEDDVLETAIINLLRGTGRKGLASLASQSDLLRPLLHLSKRDIQAYARRSGLTWHEDSTNQDLKYLRNYVRHKVVPRFDSTSRQAMVGVLNRQRELNLSIDHLVINLLHQQERGRQINRSWFNQLPHVVARDVMAVWLRQQNVLDFDTKLLERLVIGAKVAAAGKRLDVLQGKYLLVSKKFLALQGPER